MYKIDTFKDNMALNIGVTFKAFILLISPSYTYIHVLFPNNY